MHSCVAPSEFGGPWPDGTPVQIHLMERDELVLPPEQDLAAARELEEAVDGAELFLYDGEAHLFTDDTLADYDERATALLKRRLLAFLQAVG